MAFLLLHLGLCFSLDGLIKDLHCLFWGNSDDSVSCKVQASNLEIEELSEGILRVQDRLDRVHNSVTVISINDLTSLIRDSRGCKRHLLSRSNDGTVRNSSLFELLHACRVDKVLNRASVVPQSVIVNARVDSCLIERHAGEERHECSNIDADGTQHKAPQEGEASLSVVEVDGEEGNDGEKGPTAVEDEVEGLHVDVHLGIGEVDIGKGNPTHVLAENETGGLLSIVGNVVGKAVKRKRPDGL